VSGAPNPLATRPFHLLIVCTANQARSPLGEVIARDLLDRRGIDGWVGSAGFHRAGHPAAPGSVEVAASRGLDLSHHVSRTVDERLVRSADLVVTMQASHVADLATAFPASEVSTMTLRELAIAAQTGPMDVDAVHRWVRETAAARSPLDLATRQDLDVEDPMGRDVEYFRRAADEIDALFRRVFDTWFGGAR
jgi:protein-tyrosine-phosphatase